MVKKAIRSISRSKDLRKLRDIVRGLIGQKCWKAEFSYGSDFLLHFGARIPCDHPKLADEEEGEWIFETCGTPWTLHTPIGPLISTTDDESCRLNEIKRYLYGNKV